MCTINVNSLTNKTTFVYNLLQSHSVDIISISETWLVSSMSSSFVDLPGFNFFRGDVVGEVRKHGTGLFVRKEFKAVPLDVTVPNVVAVEVPELGCSFVSCYRPPSYTEVENSMLRSFLCSFCVGRTVVILGDLNLPSIKWGDDGLAYGGITAADRPFLESFLVAGLRQWVTEGTFFPSGNTLDLVLTSDHDVVGEVSVLPPLPGCHHCPVVAQLFPHTMEIQQTDELTARLWYKGRYSEINEVLMTMDWDGELDALSSDQMYERFLNIIHPLIEEFVPMRSCRSSSLGWDAAPPRSLVREKANLWGQYKTLRRELGRTHEASVEALRLYNETNYNVRTYSRTKQWQYEYQLADRLREMPKLFHSYIRRKKKGKPSIGPLKHMGVVLSEPVDMCEVLADVFSSIYNNLPPPDIPRNELLELEIMTPISISYDDVHTRLSELKSTSSPGPDQIHPFLLKSCAAALAYPLVKIFRKSLAEGEVPREWKRSAVVPLFKNGSRCAAANHRPVSLTSDCCKTMERILAQHIVDFMEEHNLFSNNQFGFRKDRGTEDQLLLFYSEVISQVDAGGCVDIAFLDLSKAFDVLNHQVLLEKLRCLRFDDGLVLWIGSFLQSRSMAVKIAGCSSTVREVTSGVPQGSVLGPVLFLVYVNELMRGSECSWKAFADDFKIFSSVVTGTDTRAEALQRDLTRVLGECEAHNLVLNKEKSVIMRIGNRAGTPNPVYSLGSHSMVVVDSYKDLGVTIDSKLKFHEHVRMTVGKAGGLQSELLRSTVCRAPEFMVSLFVSHIRPIIDYCSCVWNVGYRQDLVLLESLQRRWTRETSGMAHLPYDDRLRELGLYSVTGRLKRSDMIKVWKSFNSPSDTGLSNLFVRATYEGTRGHSFKLSVPRVHSELGRRAFAARCVTLWNSLPGEVVESTSLDSFKKGLDREMGDQLYQTY